MDEEKVFKAIEERLKKEVNFKFKIISVRQKGEWALARVEAEDIILDGVDVLVKDTASGPVVISYGSDLTEWKKIVPPGLIT
jgi:hypothetical protein